MCAMLKTTIRRLLYEITYNNNNNLTIIEILITVFSHTCLRFEENNFVQTHHV